MQQKGGVDLELASITCKDLLTIRADRDSYYYGAEDLFKRLCGNAWLTESCESGMLNFVADRFAHY